jgi:hypothetical protein
MDSIKEFHKKDIYKQSAKIKYYQNIKKIMTKIIFKIHLMIK